MLSECPRCHIAAPSSRARYCPRCGGPLPDIPTNTVKPIMLEKRGTLLNPWFGAGLAVVVAGTWLASLGHLRAAAVTILVGVPLLIIATVRSHSK